MRFLYRPSAREELLVRGRYEFVDAAGSTWASEQWERYRNDGSPVQTWRSEWRGQWAGQPFVLLAHSVVSPDGLERLKLQWEGAARVQPLTVTTMADSVLVNDSGTINEVALPPGYGLFAPLPSLARFALPFDLASEGRELAMLFFVRWRQRDARLTSRPAKFGYAPLGLREMTVQGKSLRARGWRLDAPGLPMQEGWFDRNESCLLWAVADGERAWEARLVEWMSFG